MDSMMCDRGKNPRWLDNQPCRDARRLTCALAQVDEEAVYQLKLWSNRVACPHIVEDANELAIKDLGKSGSFGNIQWPRLRPV